jgi:HEAT repeat protein
MNLAFGLLGQRIETEAACSALFEGLTEEKKRWMWIEDEFHTLAPSKLKYDETIPNYPEEVNQLVRLEVLSVLAIFKYPKAQEAIKRFLQERTWGVSGLASALLLTEGDESSIELVQELLKDPQPKVRIQAALILALWGEGENALSVLQEAYATADRDLKERILEGVGRIGSLNSIAFLVEKLGEPYQNLRVIAASALLQCLYH